MALNITTKTDRGPKNQNQPAEWDFAKKKKSPNFDIGFYRKQRNRLCQAPRSLEDDYVTKTARNSERGNCVDGTFVAKIVFPKAPPRPPRLQVGGRGRCHGCRAHRGLAGAWIDPQVEVLLRLPFLDIWWVYRESNSKAKPDFGRSRIQVEGPGSWTSWLRGYAKLLWVEI